MSKENSNLFSFIQNPETALKWRNVLLYLVVPGAIWFIHDIIFVTGPIITQQDIPLDQAERVKIGFQTAIKLSSAYIPLKLSEYAHIRFRQLDPTIPLFGLVNRFFDTVAEHKNK